MCTMCVPHAYGDQKRALGPLRLELWVVVSHLVVLGTDSRFSVRAVSALILQAIFPHFALILLLKTNEERTFYSFCVHV